MVCRNVFTCVILALSSVHCVDLRGARARENDGGQIHARRASVIELVSTLEEERESEERLAVEAVSTAIKDQKLFSVEPIVAEQNAISILAHAVTSVVMGSMRKKERPDLVSFLPELPINEGDGQV